MLSAADAALVARDRAIPGLALLLDADAFAEALQIALPEARVTAAAATYVRYKPGTNCLVGYRVTTADGAAPVYARAFSEPLRVKLDHARALPGKSGALGAGGFVDDDWAVAVYGWPHDRSLKALKQIVDPEKRARMIKHLAPYRRDLRHAAIHDLRYKPERRYVGRLAGADGECGLLKLYDDGDYAQARDAAGAFQERGTLRLAQRLGYDDRRQALLFGWRAGRPLDELLAEPSCALAAIEMAGAALAELHSQRPTRLKRRGPDAETCASHSTAEAIATVTPELGPRARRLAAALTDGLGSRPSRVGPVHGDFYAGQVLVVDGGIALLDLDNAAYDAPDADIGSFAAHLHRDELRGMGTPGRVERMIEALLGGYRAYRTIEPPIKLNLYTAASLFRLAPEAFRRREADWPERIEALLSRAEEIATHVHITA